MLFQKRRRKVDHWKRSSGYAQVENLESQSRLPTPVPKVPTGISGGELMYVCHDSKKVSLLLRGVFCSENVTENVFSTILQGMTRLIPAYQSDDSY